MGELSPWHLLILAAVFVLLFGAKKLPDAARSMGKSLRIFKTEIKGLHDDEQQTQPARPAEPQQLTAAPGAPSVEQQTSASAIGDNVDGR
ncbi:MAG TPA: Sec-independent protein translocase subunit TatA [Mycobacteriales bacterium]|nr:Sec-independent protein translocase subunit TatA [Mycobacteriales bacterium]